MNISGVSMCLHACMRVCERVWEAVEVSAGGKHTEMLHCSVSYLCRS